MWALSMIIVLVIIALVSLSFQADDLPDGDKKPEYNYEKKCKRTNGMACFAPFFLVFIPVLVAVGFDLWFLGIPIALFLGSGAAMIGMTAGHQLNIQEAKEHDVPASDPRLQYEKKERDIGIVATTIAVTSVGKKTKDAVKDVCDVDGWDKRKQK